MFRRTNPQLVGQGGLWDTAMSIYNSLPQDKRPKVRHRDLEFVFPNENDLDENGVPKRTGARVKYRSMQHEKDKYDSQGLQYSLVGFDEGTQFSWSQIEYLQSRMRSASKYFSRMVISCNPDNDHELKTWISWYLDEDGYPIPEREGVTRYFTKKDGEPVWGDSPEELKELYGERSNPLSFTFVSGTVYRKAASVRNNCRKLCELLGHLKKTISTFIMDRKKGVGYEKFERVGIPSLLCY